MVDSFKRIFVWAETVPESARLQQRPRTLRPPRTCTLAAGALLRRYDQDKTREAYGRSSKNSHVAVQNRESSGNKNWWEVVSE